MITETINYFYFFPHNFIAGILVLITIRII